ncbi:hypothetical protein D0T53_07530 [Dysgonomonas sp. 216]|uniref:hypothetical protein n=1 Tax=Dysgonomonas sp. 216 TaxID=2302934 RepID=UPI0013D630F5|nr:hypothetical protein [Dysgonomonas sp. 216]NDW18763.1 hypothetical protein [Dysgonomonas sp. 216]
MIQIIVVTASILLGLMLYPALRKIYSRTVTKLYKGLQSDETGTEEKPPQKTDEKPSVIGESKFNLRQSTPNTATNPETEKANEKEHIFASESGEEDAEMDIDVPLEKTGDRNDELDPEEEEEEEAMEEMAGPGATLASGVVFDELLQVKVTIGKTDSTEHEERQAGRILSQNLGTAFFGQIMESGTALSARISYLIDMQDKALAGEREARLSKKQRKELDTEGFKNFDIDSIF